MSMKDWKVWYLTDRLQGPYRYRVSGENLNFPEDHYDRWFCWDVPDLDTERYDLSRAQAIGNHDSRHWSNPYRKAAYVTDAADNTGDF